MIDMLSGLSEEDWALPMTGKVGSPGLNLDVKDKARFFKRGMIALNDCSSCAIPGTTSRPALLHPLENHLARRA